MDSIALIFFVDDQDKFIKNESSLTFYAALLLVLLSGRLLHAADDEVKNVGAAVRSSVCSVARVARRSRTCNEEANILKPECFRVNISPVFSFVFS